MNVWPISQQYPVLLCQPWAAMMVPFSHEFQVEGGVSWRHRILTVA